jgi:hypothetical protein
MLSASVEVVGPVMGGPDSDQVLVWVGENLGDGAAFTP